MNHDKRITERLEAYWQLVRGNNEFPEIQQFNHATVEDIWPQCMMVSINSGSGINYRYEYMGEAVIKAYGQDLTGMPADYKMNHFPGAVVLKKLDKIVENHQVDFDNGHLLNKDGGMIKYRACFLPFGNAKKGLTHIIVGLSLRVF